MTDAITDAIPAVEHVQEQKGSRTAVPKALESPLEELRD